MNILQTIEQEQVAKLMEGKKLPAFKAGDTLKVHTKVKEGERERIQVYEGVCIARKIDGLNSSFTVRKISFGEGVERVFPLYSPNVVKVEVERIGKVRRAKMYFLRALRGRSARIADDLTAAAKVREAEKAEKLANPEAPKAPKVKKERPAKETNTGKKPVGRKK
jgi:large subunit ribosomal protein L19